MDFGEKLQQLRKQRNITQEELANTLYVSRAAVSKWESGKGYPNIDSLKAVAAAFDVTVDELLSGEELIDLAKKDRQAERARLISRVFGCLDMLAAALIFLPVYGIRIDGHIASVPLLQLGSGSSVMIMVYAAALAVQALFGLCELAVPQGEKRSVFTAVSLALHGCTVLLFSLSGQPYATFFLFAFFAIKAALLIKLERNEKYHR